MRGLKHLILLLGVALISLGYLTGVRSVYLKYYGGVAIIAGGLSLIWEKLKHGGRST
ncbi:hypothetical protein [Thermococcus sp.]